MGTLTQNMGTSLKSYNTGCPVNLNMGTSLKSYNTRCPVNLLLGSGIFLCICYLSVLQCSGLVTTMRKTMFRFSDMVALLFPIFEYP